MQKYTIIKVRKTNYSDVNSDLQWIGNSFGLFGNRDKDSSCFRIFIKLYRNARQSKYLSSDDIAEGLNLSRATVVHHLNRLIDGGIVYKDKQGYILRETNMVALVHDLRRDMEKLFDSILSVAKEIDEKMN